MSVRLMGYRVCRIWLPTAAAKGGLLAMTRTLAGALAQDRIRVNYLIPGWVLTEGEIALRAKKRYHAGEALEKEWRRVAVWGPASKRGRFRLRGAFLFCSPTNRRRSRERFSIVDAGASTLPIQPDTLAYIS